MQAQVNDQLLRMADLANKTARAERTKFDKEGRKLTIKAKPATRGITGFSAKHIYSLINKGRFPSPIKIGKSSLWRLSDINKWLDEQGGRNEN